MEIPDEEKAVKISIISVGKLKEKYWRGAVEEYGKRLSRYGNLNLIEVADEKCPENAGDEDRKIIRRKEGERITAKIPEGAFLVTLEIGGKEMDSESFAGWLDKLPHRGHSHVVFVIGGSLGLDPGICRKSGLSLSFGRMTFPHQLMKVILLEQIYRAFRINRNEPYHK